MKKRHLWSYKSLLTFLLSRYFLVIHILIFTTKTSPYIIENINNMHNICNYLIINYKKLPRYIDNGKDTE